MSLRLLGRPARVVLACGLVVVAVSCGSDGSGDAVTDSAVATSSTIGANALPSTTPSGAGTIAPVVVSTVPATTVSVTVPATTPAPTAPTTLVPTTVPASSTTVIATTTLPSSPAVCDLINIIEQTQTQYNDIVPGDLNCAGDWASWVGRPADGVNADGFFAVAQWNGRTWELANLGTAEICAGGGVPRELWDALKCTE